MTVEKSWFGLVLQQQSQSWLWTLHPVESNARPSAWWLKPGWNWVMQQDGKSHAKQQICSRTAESEKKRGSNPNLETWNLRLWTPESWPREKWLIPRGIRQTSAQVLWAAVGRWTHIIDTEQRLFQQASLHDCSAWRVLPNRSSGLFHIFSPWPNFCRSESQKIPDSNEQRSLLWWDFDNFKKKNLFTCFLKAVDTFFPVYLWDE